MRRMEHPTLLSEGCYAPAFEKSRDGEKFQANLFGRSGHDLPPRQSSSRVSLLNDSGCDLQPRGQSELERFRKERTVAEQQNKALLAANTRANSRFNWPQA